MNGYLLDTHIWIWHALGDPVIPRGIRRLLDERLDSCWLSPISLWEVVLLARKKRLDIGPDPLKWIGAALDAAPLREASLTFAVAQRAHALTHVGDPADAMIAATAQSYDLTLVTVDRRLRALKDLRTISR